MNNVAMGLKTVQMVRTKWDVKIVGMVLCFVQRVVGVYQHRNYAMGLMIVRMDQMKGIVLMKIACIVKCRCTDVKQPEDVYTMSMGVTQVIAVMTPSMINYSVSRTKRYDDVRLKDFTHDAI